MDDVRANVLTELATLDTNAQANYDFKSNEYAEKNVLGGKYPITTLILGVGDLRIIERKSWSHGNNLVRCEIDILQFTRSLPTSTTLESTLDTTLSVGLTKSSIQSANTLTCELREAETFTQIHDNIWRRIWTLEVLLLESL